MIFGLSLWLRILADCFRPVALRATDHSDPTGGRHQRQPPVRSFWRRAGALLCVDRTAWPGRLGPGSGHRPVRGIGAASLACRRRADVAVCSNASLGHLGLGNAGGNLLGRMRLDASGASRHRAHLGVCGARASAPPSARPCAGESGQAAQRFDHGCVRIGRPFRGA